MTNTLGLIQVTNPKFTIGAPNECFMNGRKYQNLKYYCLCIVSKKSEKEHSLNHNKIKLLLWNSLKEKTHIIVYFTYRYMKIIAITKCISYLLLSGTNIART